MAPQLGIVVLKVDALIGVVLLSNQPRKLKWLEPVASSGTFTLIMGYPLSGIYVLAGGVPVYWTVMK